MKTLFRWIILLLLALYFTYFLPPSGFAGAKFVLAVVTAIGTGFAGLVQLRVAKNSNGQPLKAVAIGGGVRIVFVIVLVVIALTQLPESDRLGNVIAIMAMYFAIQLAELPTIVRILSQEPPTKNDEK